MSRRKQANPAKLGESDAGAPGAPDIAGIPMIGDDTAPAHAQCEQQADANGHGDDGDNEVDEDELEDDDDVDLDDTDDDDGSLLNGQGSSPMSSSDGSPSSCQSSLSDAADAAEEGGYTLGATPTTPYECDVCKRAFPRSSQLSKHLQSHTEQLQFSCPYCRRLFKHKRSRDRHTKLHTGDKKYKCLHCESAFARSDHLKIHMKTHDNKKPHQCDLCNRGYNTAAALASHQQHHSKQESSRSSISSSSPSPSLLNVDKMEVPSRKCEVPEEPNTAALSLPKITCMYCGKDFMSMTHMYAHIHADHRAIYTSNAAPLDLHSPNQNQIQNQNLTLTSNPINPKIEDLSASPKTRPSSAPTYACDRCTMRFDSSPHLQEHVENVHWTALPRYKYEHDAQGDREQKPTDLSRKRRHEDECIPIPVKSKPNPNSNPKTSHEKRHALEPAQAQDASPYEANDKPCICSYCYAQMPNFKMFLLHMETHVINTSPVQAKTPTCPLCGEAAKNALELGRHIFGHAIASVAAYCCHACKKPFDKAENLRKHLLDAHAQTIYKCTICNELFDTDQSLQMHFGSKHAVECKHFRCNLCSDQVFHDRLTAELHVNMKHSLASPHHPTAPGNFFLIDDHHLERAPYYQCPFCQKLFKDEYLQYVHILREHNHRLGGAPQGPQVDPKASKPPISPHRFRCNICQKSTASEAELATHKKLHHTKLRTVSLQCAYCNEHCKSRADLEHHMKTHQVSSTGKGKHKCNICDEIFGSATTLAEHKLSHCKIVAGNSCTQCKTLLSDEQSFYQHQLQHGTSSSGANNKNLMSLPANCIVCCQTLQTDVEIKLHASFHLGHLRQQKEYLCAVCNKLYESSNVHTVHSIVVCKDCALIAPQHVNGNKSPSKSSPKPNSSSPVALCRGYDTNTNAIANTKKEKAHFACLKCPRTFAAEDDMQHHAITHQEESGSSSSRAALELECHLCRNVLPTPIKLQVHLIEHNFMGIGQYRCYVCSSVFTTAAGLRGHIVEHGPDARPYECADCNTKFYFESELENHKFVHLQLQQPRQSYEKYVECSRCGASVAELAYYAEHVHTCSSGTSTSASNGIVNIKVEKKNLEHLEYEAARSERHEHKHKEIKTEAREAGSECNAPVV